VSEALIPVQRALAERRVLALDYQGGKRPGATRRDVEPLGLVYYADNWHLIGWCRLRRDVRDFRTDRILKLELRDELCPARPDFSLKTYLEEQQTCDGNFAMAQIRFQPETMERVRREHHWGLVEETPERDGITMPADARSGGWPVGCCPLHSERWAGPFPPTLVAAEAQQLATQRSTPGAPARSAAAEQRTPTSRRPPWLRVVRSSRPRAVDTPICCDARARCRLLQICIVLWLGLCNRCLPSRHSRDATIKSAPIPVILDTDITATTLTIPGRWPYCSNRPTDLAKLVVGDWPGTISPRLLREFLGYAGRSGCARGHRHDLAPRVMTVARPRGSGLDLKSIPAKLLQRRAGAH
jgi:hypothetical protein